MSFVKSFSHHFRSYRHDVTEKARQYASGLMQAGARKNMDRMAEVVPDSKSRNLQQFLTHSKWDARSVIDHVARDANQCLGDEQRAGLLIDESGFAKQGPMSVGVSRQWLGRLGKVDNGQVAVFGVLSRDRFAIPVDVKLYLPKKWTEDPKRCAKAGIPEAERVFRTKEQLALEIVSHARQNGLRFGIVHEVKEAKQLESAVDSVIKTLLLNSPDAMRKAKTLCHQCHQNPIDQQLIHYTSKLIADIRVSPQGQDGLQAFLEKRSPSWITKSQDK